jgi:CheY-like chemotaxis protein
MTFEAEPAAGTRVLVVEDESMIRLLLDDMLRQLGYTMTAEAGALGEAMTAAKQANFDLAILDVDLDGDSITPVAELLSTRGVPFVFASGYDEPAAAKPYAGVPLLEKPFQIEALARALAVLAEKAPQ